MAVAPRSGLGLHDPPADRLHLGAEITVTHDERYAEYDIYDPDSGTARYEGHDYSIVGLNGGEPLLRSSQGETLVLNREVLRIDRGGQVEHELVYGNFSGDWAMATFSRDGQWVVLGCPYDFDFVVLERVRHAG